jgi:hypothetical protein
VIAAKEARKQTGNHGIAEGLPYHSLKRNIENYTKSFSEPVHVLANNASTIPRQRIETEGGIKIK